MSNLLSSLISLRTLYEFSTADPTSQGYIKYLFSDYLNDSQTYFETIKNSSYQWYDMIITKFGELEDKIGKYLKKDGMLFWGTQSVTYTDLNSTISITDDEAFPMGLGQVLNGVNSLLKNDEFVLSDSQSSDNYSLSYIEYAGSLAIENAYLNLLPSQFEKIKSIPVIFKDFNKKALIFF